MREASRRSWEGLGLTMTSKLGLGLGIGAGFGCQDRDNTGLASTCIFRIIKGKMGAGKEVIKKGRVVISTLRP